DEFGTSEKFECCIHLLTEDNDYLEFTGSSIASDRLADAVVKDRPIIIDLKRAGTFRKVVMNKECIRTTTADIMDEMFHGGSRNLTSSAAGKLGCEKWDAVVLPFCRTDSPIGAISIIHPELPAEFISLAKVFCRQISIAHRLVHEAAQARLVEEALRSSKAQFSNALQIARLGPWEYDVLKDQFTFNDEFYNIFRTTAEQVGGYTMSSADYARTFLHPDEIQMVGEEIGKALATTDPHYSRLLEHKILYADGAIGTISVRIFIVKDDQGRTVKTYGVNQDITERRKAEEELQQYRHQLEELVAERTEELKKELIHRKQAEEELQKAQKLESLGLLAGGIAHDFNNLLSGLFIFVDMARRNLGKKDTIVRECLDEAMGCCSRTRDLTQQLLTFAKGGMPVKKTLALEPIIQKTAKLSLSGSNVHCNFELPPTLWTIKGDEGQLSQVFSNILLNSRQAMSNGGLITLAGGNVELRKNEIIDLPEGSYVRIVFSDQGSGIKKDVLSRVFDPFFTTKQTGSGLGLATSYSIIKKHEGHISIDSEVGSGTVVTIHLPASKDAIPEERTELPADLKGYGRILFMDDDEVICNSVTMILEEGGYEIVCAKNGEEAIALYRESFQAGNPFSAAILDLTIVGGMGGEKVIRKLQEIDPQVKGIVSSGYADSPVLSNPAEYGFMGDIAKPYVVDDLLRTLNTVLRNNAENG
ncbi:MAG: response regulator, partial [Candidatus Latescibacteria bacterium]|nr:response regulator [Candidatus Latescibacterota bacterium]